MDSGCLLDCCSVGALFCSIIAEKLKKTSKVVAEFFENASIFMSDIVGFNKLVAESRPAEVVILLNDLYAALDAVISGHDVYKVFRILCCMVLAGFCKMH